MPDPQRIKIKTQLLRERTPFGFASRCELCHKVSQRLDAHETILTRADVQGCSDEVKTIITTSAWNLSLICAECHTEKTLINVKENKRQLVQQLVKRYGPDFIAMEISRLHFINPKPYLYLVDCERTDDTHE